MLFWLIIGAATLATILVLARRMLRVSPQTMEEGEQRLTSDMRVYRDQLSELERDVARGTVTAEDADRARTEISRRLLDADKAAQAKAPAGEAPAGLTRLTLALVAILIVGSGFGLYWQMGSPGYPDLGRAKRIAMSQEMRDNRPSQEQLEASAPAWPGPPPDAPAEYLSLVDTLRSAVAKRQDDPTGLDLLARHEAALGNMIAAREAMAKLLILKGDDASADDLTRQAELMISAANGTVSAEAEELLKRALTATPGHQLARYYTGILFSQNGRPDLAFRLWRGLLEEGPSDAIWYESVRGQIPFLAESAGETYTLPAPAAPTSDLRGPSAEDMANAQDMSEEDRSAMIQGMIERLSDRLASEGGSPEEWARLITALGVTGDTDRAAAIWDEAQTVFATAPEALATLRAAAQQAGITQ